MPIVNLTNFWRIVVEGHVVSTGGSHRKCFNVYHYASLGTAVDNPGVKGNVATFFNAHIWSPIAALLHSDYICDGIYAWKMSDPTDSLTLAATGANGGQGGARLPLNQAVFGYVGSGERGNYYHGSKRYGPIAASDVVSDELTPSQHTAWETAHNGCATTMVFFVGHLVWEGIPLVYSRTLSNTVPTLTPQIGAYVTQTYCDKTLSQWRHRREKTQL